MGNVGYFGGPQYLSVPSDDPELAGAAGVLALMGFNPSAFDNRLIWRLVSR